MFSVNNCLFSFTGECIECYNCFLGANNSYLYSNFPLSICLYNNSLSDHKTCEACMKLIIQGKNQKLIQNLIKSYILSYGLLLFLCLITGFTICIYF